MSFGRELSGAYHIPFYGISISLALLMMNLYVRTLSLGRIAGPIFTIILFVDCLFFMFLEWFMPRENLDYVTKHWDQERFFEVCFFFLHHVCFKLEPFFSSCSSDFPLIVVDTKFTASTILRKVTATICKSTRRSQHEF